MQTNSENVSTTSGVPVQMVSPQLSLQAQTMQTQNLSSQSSGHYSMMYPTMTMTQASLQHQVQEIQQNVTSNSEGSVQMVMPSLSTQTQAVQSGNTPQNSSNHPTMMHSTVNATQPQMQHVQVIPMSYFQQVPQQQMFFPGNMALQHAGTTTVQNIASTQNLGLQMQSEQAVLDPKSPVNSQTFQIINPVSKAFSNQTMLTKPVYSSALLSTSQVSNANQLKHITSQPPITTQASGTVYNQPQIYGSFSALPQGLTWATPNNFQPSTIFLSPNSTIIRNQQPSMFIQSPAQTAMFFPVAAGSSPASGSVYAVVPQKQANSMVQYKPVAVAQNVSPSVEAHRINKMPIARARQVRPRAKVLQPNFIQLPTVPTQHNQIRPQFQAALLPNTGDISQTLVTQIMPVTTLQSDLVTVPSNLVNPLNSSETVAKEIKKPQAHISAVLKLESVEQTASKEATESPSNQAQTGVVRIAENESGSQTLIAGVIENECNKPQINPEKPSESHSTGQTDLKETTESKSVEHQDSFRESRLEIIEIQTVPNMEVRPRVLQPNLIQIPTVPTQLNQIRPQGIILPNSSDGSQALASQIMPVTTLQRDLLTVPSNLVNPLNSSETVVSEVKEPPANTPAVVKLESDELEIVIKVEVESPSDQAETGLGAIAEKESNQQTPITEVIENECNKLQINTKKLSESHSAGQTDVTEVTVSESVELQNGPRESIELQNDPRESIELQNDPRESIELQNDPRESVEPQNGYRESVEPQNGYKESVELQNGPRESVEPQNGPRESVEPQNGPKESIELQNGPREPVLESDQIFAIPSVGVIETAMPTHLAESLNLRLQVPVEKHRQRAIVRPHILTHVIDGFVIYESSEPFPVSKSALLSPVKNNERKEPDESKTRLKIDEPNLVELKKADELKSNVEKTVERKTSLEKTEESNPNLGKTEEPKVHELEKEDNVNNSEEMRVEEPKKGVVLKITNQKSPKEPEKADKLKKNDSEKLDESLVTHPEKVPKTPSKRGRKRKLRDRRGWKKLAENSLNNSQVEVIDLDLGEEQASAEKTVETSASLEESVEKSESEEKVNSDTLPIETSAEVTAVEKAKEAEKPENHFSQKLPTAWSVQDVYEFVKDIGGCADYAEEFKSQEIDGRALLLLKVDHIVTFTSMKFGPAIKLISCINSMKEKLSLET